MTDSANPLRSMDEPTDDTFKEILDTGKDFLQQNRLVEQLEQASQQVPDVGMLADNPAQALQDVVSVPLGAAVDAVESVGSFLDLSGDTFTTAANTLFGYGQPDEENPFSKNYKKGNWIDIPDRFTPETKSGFGKLLRGLGEFGLLAVATSATGGALAPALGGAVKATGAGTKLLSMASKFKAGSRPIQFLTSPKMQKIGKIAGEGAVADFIMNDSEEANIANLVNQYAPMIPFSEALQINEEDNPWFARIKSVTAGAGANLVGHALVGFLKGKVFAKKRAKELIEEQKLLTGSDPKLLKGGTDALGKGFVIKDFYADVINRANNEGTAVAQKYIRKNIDQDEIHNKELADFNYNEGKGVRADVDYLDLYLRKYLHEGDYEEAQRLLAGEKLKGDIVIKGDPAEGFPDRTIKEQDRIVDTRGKGTYFHGTSVEIDKLDGPADANYYQEGGPGLFGYGFYTTDDIITAIKYKNKKTKKVEAELSNPLIYQTRKLQDVKFYDLDTPMTKTAPFGMNEALKWMDESIAIDSPNSVVTDISDILSDTLDLVGRDGSLADFIRASRKIAWQDYDMDAWEHAEYILEPLQERLQKSGFGGYTHQGGLYAGKGKRMHQVEIYWDPRNQIELGKTSTETATLQDYIDLALAKGKAGGDTWLPELGKSSKQDAVDRLRKPDPAVNPNKFGESEKATERIDTDSKNIYAENLNEATLNRKAGRRPVGSTTMATEPSIRRMTNDDRSLRKFITEIMDNTVESSFRQIDNAQPWSDHLDTIFQKAKEINDIVGVGGEEGLRALRRYLNADLGTKRVSVDDLTGRENFIFWDFDGEKIITITPQMKNALTIAIHYNLRKAADIGTGVTMLPKGANATRQAINILDHLQIAMVELKKISYMTGNALQVQRGDGIFPQAARAKHSKRLKQIIQEEKTFTQNLKDLLEKGDKRGARQLSEIYAITDGNVRSLSMMQSYLKARLGFGGVVDGNKINSQLLRELSSVYYSSILSSPKTPIRAVVGTNLITVLRPFQMWAGANLPGRVNREQSALAAAVIDGIGKAYSESWKIFKHNWDQGVHNQRLSYTGRFDLPNDLKNFQRLGKYAEEFGTDSEKTMYQVINRLVRLNTNPFMRYSQNIMGAGDAAARHVIGRFTARIRAAQEGIDKGIPLDNLTDYAKSQEQRFIDQIFQLDKDNQYVVTDGAALMAGREATMTKDVEGWAKAFESLSSNPVGMLFFPFVRTGYNAVRLTVQHTPLEMMQRRFKDIRDGVNLEKYGLTAADLPAERALQDGRIAMGSTIASMAFIGAMTGSIYGDVPRDKEMRDLWKMEGIRPHTMRIGNTMFSYRDLEPFNTIIATAANLANYQHALDENIRTEMFETLSFMAAATLVDKSMLAGVEDLAAVLDPEGLANKGGRLVSKTLRSALPYSGLLGSMGDVLDANQKEANNMWEMMIRRDAMFKSTIPPKYDMLAKDRSGKKLEMPGANPLMRTFNLLSPVAVTNTSGDPVKTMLYEIGYNLPEVTKTYKGLRLTSTERSMMSKYISMSSLRKNLERIMLDPNGSFQTGYKEFKALGLTRRAGYRVEDQKFYKMIQKEFRKAKKEAYTRMKQENSEIANKLKEQERKRRSGALGNYDTIKYLIEDFPK